MDEYPKIPTLFKRDPDTKFRTLIEDSYAMPELAYLRFNQWLLTEKVNGTNIRVMWRATTGLTFGGKTDNAQIPTHLANRLNEMFQAKEFAAVFDEDACLYGEGYGAKIQKGGGNYSATQEFVLFDVKVGDWWLERPDVEDVAEKLGLRCVPVYARGPLLMMVNIVRGGFKSCWGDFPAEGLVARPAVFLVARNGSRVIAKLKTKDFAPA